jgi:CHAT domain-containing protein
MVYAGDEADEVASRLRVRPFSGGRATVAAILARLPTASIVHFATHARFVPGSPLEAAISLADGDLTAREVMTLPLRADLVVLSACETGRAESLAGDEVAGLAMALLQAGARTVLVSLWPVSGLATATMMSAFYDAWTVRRDKGAALADAMTALRDGAWPCPYYWGAFVLVGDWS